MKEILDNFRGVNEKEPERKFVELKTLINELRNAQGKIETTIIESLNTEKPELGLLEDGKDPIQEKSIGQEAEQYFREISQSGLYEPEKEYISDSEQSIGKKNYLEDLLKEEGLKEFTQEMEPSYSILKKGTDRFHIFTQVVKQQYSHNLIREIVISPIDKPGEYPVSFLQFFNQKNKITININELLPKDVFLLSDELDKRADIKRRVYGSEDHSFNITQYKETQSGETTGFCYVPQYEYYEDGKEIVAGKVIRYSDLTKPGGFLSLLHEVGHSWEHEYFEDYGIGPLEDWLSQVHDRVSKYLRAERDNEVRYKHSLKLALDDLGVSFSNDENKDLERVEFLLKDLKISSKKEEFNKNEQSIITLQEELVDTKLYSERLSELMEGYVRQERVAWAHAIRVLRFLRDQGIDLEPTFKKEKDFTNFIYPCLQSYNKTVEDIEGITFPSKVKKFVRVDKEEKDNSENSY